MAIEHYPEPPKRISELNGLGPKSEEMLAEVGIHSVEEFMAIDPYELYARLKPRTGTGLNFLYAILGARENLSWI